MQGTEVLLGSISFLQTKNVVKDQHLSGYLFHYYHLKLSEYDFQWLLHCKNGFYFQKKVVKDYTRTTIEVGGSKNLGYNQAFTLIKKNHLI